MDTGKCPFIGIDCEYIPLARKSDAQAKEIEQLRLANSDLQMHYDYAKTEHDKLKAEVQRLRGSLAFISMLTPLSGQSWESHARFINAYAIYQLEEEE